MGKFDNDSDGLLDLEEFKALMNRNQKKKIDNWAKTNTSTPYVYIHEFSSLFIFSLLFKSCCSYFRNIIILSLILWTAIIENI